MRQRGQALVETAVTLPILVVLFLGFLAVGVAAQAYVDLNTAVNLAAASEATAPSNDPADAVTFRDDTFNGTINNFPQLRNAQITCNDAGPTGPFSAGATINCTGTARFTLVGTPMEIVIPIPPPPFSATASATRSPYRSEKV
jgi:Flp pilus assembly protein TadG